MKKGRKINCSRYLYLLTTFILACVKDPVPSVKSNHYSVSTVASIGYGYKDGPVNIAKAESIGGIVFDLSGNLYFADTYGNRIRKISPEGIVSTLAGTGDRGFKDGNQNQAQFYNPVGMAIDDSGNLYVAQSYAIRKITPSGITTTVLGVGTKGVSSTHLGSDTTAYPSIDGSLLLLLPKTIAFDKIGNLFVTEIGNNARIIKVTPDKKISVYYGTPFSMNARTVENTNQIIAPNGIVFNKNGNLLISDSSLGIIKLTVDGIPMYFTGDGYKGHVDGLPKEAEFTAPTSAVLDSFENLYVGDDKYIRKIDPDGNVSTIVGNGNSVSATQPLMDGTGDKAQISNPKSMAFDSKGNLYVVDDGGIRKITFN